VHRASLAVYTDLPVVQLQRDRELLSLCGSILRQGNEIDVRRSPSSLPAFQLLSTHCHKEAAATRLQRFAARRANTQFVGWDSRSPVDVFLQAARRFGLQQLLPPKKLLLSTGRRAIQWDHRRWKDTVRRATQTLSVERLLNESRGYAYAHRGWKFGRLTKLHPCKDKEYGAELTPLLGVPAQHHLPHADLLDDAVQLVKKDLSFSARTLSEDRKKHAQLRARVTLNRSAFHAVRSHRSTDPLAPRRCQQCPDTPLETARHVLLSCPRYTLARNELKSKLAAQIERIRTAKNSHVQWRQCIQNDDELLFHIILATPFVLSQLKDKYERANLLVYTGDFLLTIHDIRPT